MVTESSTKPLATVAGWSASAPASYTFSTAGTKTLYAWAKDAAGNVSASMSASVTITISDTVAPSAPTGLTASTATNSVKLTWNASSDNVGVTGYLILRDGAQIGTSAAAGYTDMTVAASTTYNYTVEATDAAGNVSAPSNTATVTTQAGGAATGVSGSFSLDLFGWQSSQDNFWDKLYNLGLDGQGNFTYSQVGSSDDGSSTGTGTVSLTDEGLLYFDALDGIAAPSSDGKVLAWADSSETADNSLSIGLGFAKPTTRMSNATLKGKYLLGGVTTVENSTGQTTAKAYLYNMTFKGDGTMTYSAVSSTSGTGDDSGSRTASRDTSVTSTKIYSGKYSVSRSGSVSMTINNMNLKGSVKDGGRLISLVQPGSSLKDGIAVGIPVSTGMSSASLSGGYAVAQTVLTGSSAWTGISRMDFDGNGNFSAQDLYSSDGQPYAAGGTYRVAAGGQLTMSTGDSGMISPDEQVFMSVDRGNPDGSIGLRIGVKE